MKSFPAVTAFNAGEFSPLMEGRVDLQNYAHSCRKTRNFIPAPQGPMRRRPGTRFVSEVKDSTHRTWLTRMVFSADQAYVLEFGNFYIRFYANHGVVVDGFSVPVEVTSPYSWVDLIDPVDGTFALRFVPSGDVVYIFSKLWPPYKLTRIAASAFTIAKVSITDGPFHDIDPATGITVYADGRVGTVNLVASAPVFRPSILAPSLMVGSLFLLEQKNYDAIPYWEPGKRVFLGDLRRSDGKTYKAMGGMPTVNVIGSPNNCIACDVPHNLAVGNPVVITGGAGLMPPPLVSGTTYYVESVPNERSFTVAAKPGDVKINLTADQAGAAFTGPGLTGSIKPVHTSNYLTGTRAIKTDGDNGVQWEYEDPGYGWGTITSITDDTHAQLGVLSPLPNAVVGNLNGTPRWAWGQWNFWDGFPTVGTFFKERLCAVRGRDFFASVAGDFESFADRDDGGLVTADMAIQASIASDRADPVKWLVPSIEALLIGTGGDEHAMYANEASTPFGPGNAAIRKQSEYGSRGVPAITVGDEVIYVQASGRKVRNMRLSAESVDPKWISNDITILAEHVSRTGIIQMAYQQEPDALLWVITADGRLAAITLNREQEVKGWHQHRIGGYIDQFGSGYAQVESIASIPSPDLGRDEVWMIVNRWVNGQSRRYVEFIEKTREEVDDPMDAFFVDAGLTLNNAPASDLSAVSGTVAETVVGSLNVPFISISNVFSAGDVGRYIHYSYSRVGADGKTVWDTAVAKITSFVSATEVWCTILRAWPTSGKPGQPKVSYASTMKQGTWRLTVTTISGLGHLANELVDICADGADCPQQQVSAGGTITLTGPASKVHIGIPCPAVLQPMPIVPPSPLGPTLGITKRTNRILFRFHDSLGVKYGRDEDQQLDEMLARGGGDAMNMAPPLFTGDVKLAWPDGYDKEALITIVADRPLPCEVVAIAPIIDTEEDA